MSFLCIVFPREVVALRFLYRLAVWIPKSGPEFAGGIFLRGNLSQSSETGDCSLYGSQVHQLNVSYFGWPFL